MVDSTGRVPPTLRVFDDSAPTLIATTERTPGATLSRWAEAGAEVAVIDRDADGAVALRSLIAELGKRDVQGLLVEGGATLAWSAVRDDVVDRIVVYLAPILIGGSNAASVIAGRGFAPLANAASLASLEVTAMGDDLKVVADVHGHR